MPGEGPLTLGVAVALLVLGVLVGRVWAQSQMTRGNRPGGGQRSHYLMGLNYLVSNQPDLAIRELSRSVGTETDAIEAYLALGNLFREKGQAERAIDIHKSLLHRAGLSPEERLQALFSLGMDFKKAGLMDRAERTLREVVEHDPENVACLHTVRQVYEEMGRWADAVDVQRRIDILEGSREGGLRAALHYEWGNALRTDRCLDEAEVRFRQALDEDPNYPAAHIGLAECLLARGDIEDAADHLEMITDAGPPWAGAALERLAGACAELGQPERLRSACQRVLRSDTRSWRALLVLGRSYLASGEIDAARDGLTAALRERPASMDVQRALWRSHASGEADEGSALFEERVGAVLDEHRLIDPYICLRCRIKSTELFARCPHCHEWNTMAEERS